MVKRVEDLELDQRKWQIFLIDGNIRAYTPIGYTIQSIWQLRLEEARQRLKYAKYDERFPPRVFPRMLMIGAGTGAEIKAAQEYGYKPIGIGLLNPEQVEYAKEQGADFRVMDMHDLRFPNESFDVAYSMASFEHCVNPWLVCMEVWSVLRDRGRWWLWMGAYKGNAEDSDGPGLHHFMILPYWFIEPMFRRCGFEVIEYVDSNIDYWFLLEKLPLEEIKVRKNITALLRKRIEIGRGYSE